MGIIEIALIVILVFASLIGLLSIPLGLPGTWVMPIMALIYKVLPIPIQISWTLIITLILMALAGEILEYYVSAMSASKADATKWGIIGAVAGGIIGAIVGVPVFLVGSLVGMLIGAFFGAFIVEFFIKQNIEKAFKAGIGAFKGRIGAIIVKELIGIVMVVILIISSF